MATLAQKLTRACAVALIGTFAVTAATSANAHEMMKTLGGEMKKLGAAAAAGNNDEIAAIAKEIAAIAEKIPGDFKDKPTNPDTRAKPEIWDNFADFTAKAEDLNAAALKVAAGAEAGTLPGDAKAVVGMVGGACGACHKEYRAPEKN